MNLTEKLFMLHGHGKNKSLGYVGSLPGNVRLGIPPLYMGNGPQGFQLGGGTCWPSSLAVGASWDVALAAQWGDAMGGEFYEKGVNVQLGPAMNVQRVPTDGRQFEYVSGEDPVLGAELVGPIVQGIQKHGIIANAKHWVNNNQETVRSGMNAVVDERTRFEIYYPPFEAAINAKCGSFMCSYNKINGEYSCGNNATLNRDLKQRLGFGGFVMSDWGATHSTASINSGLDMEEPFDRRDYPQGYDA
jgi:beta-glucosidase